MIASTLRCSGSLLGALVLSLAAHATPVSAGPVELTLTGWAYGWGNTVQATGYTGPAGAFTGHLSGTGMFDSASFMTYCIELEESFRFATQPMLDYTVVDGVSYFRGRQLADARRPDGAQVAQRLGQLVSYVSDNPYLMQTAAQSTAFQLAVWNIVYDNDFSVTVNGNFNDGSRYRQAADQLLSSASAATSHVDVFALVRDGTQDFLMWVPRRATALSAQNVDVDEPIGPLLAMTAVLALWLNLRRRR